MSLQATQPDNSSIQLPPPSGNPEHAEKYVKQLIELINTEKVDVVKTDLAKFDPTSLQNHYCLNLKDYEIEVSHNKQPDTGQDFYIMLFNNLKYINDKCSQKVILAYMHLTFDQFTIFKSTAEKQLERRRKAVEEKRLIEAILPIDQMLEELTSFKSNDSNMEISTKIDHPPVFASA